VSAIVSASGRIAEGNRHTGVLTTIRAAWRHRVVGWSMITMPCGNPSAAPACPGSTNRHQLQSFRRDGSRMFRSEEHGSGDFFRFNGALHLEIQFPNLVDPPGAVRTLTCKGQRRCQRAIPGRHARNTRRCCGRRASACVFRAVRALTRSGCSRGHGPFHRHCRRMKGSEPNESPERTGANCPSDTECISRRRSFAVVSFGYLPWRPGA
jgi:hypothetical protein